MTCANCPGGGAGYSCATTPWFCGGPDEPVSVIDEWQIAIEPFDCNTQINLRACLIGSLAARLSAIDGGAELFRDSIDDAIAFGVGSTGPQRSDWR